MIEISIGLDGKPQNHVLYFCPANKSQLTDAQKQMTTNKCWSLK